MNKPIHDAYAKIILDDSSKENIYQQLTHYREKPKKRLNILFPTLITVCVLILTFVFIPQTKDESSIKSSSPNSSINQSILSSLPYELSIEDMKSRGFYINSFSKKTTYNEKALSDFLNNVENNTSASLVIACFTDEGDPILTEIIYKDNFTIYYDTTRDHFGENKVTTYTFKKIGYYENTLCAYNDTLDKETFDSGNYFLVTTRYE